MARAEPTRVLVHADESCLGNGMEPPNPGGNAALIEAPAGDSVARWDFYECSPDTTNNKMALAGAIAALEWIRRQWRHARVLYVSDSAYLIKGMTEWVKGWETRGWKRKGGALENPERVPLYEVYMRMAEDLAKRSTCARLQVGTVVTDQTLENVLAIGYNGNARGLPNRCDSAVPGNCGCIHSEMNALVKAPGSVRDKVVFLTASPCVMCAKLIINSGVTHVFYRKAYRDPSGLAVLPHAGV